MLMKDYQQDGACDQARAVLAYLQPYGDIEESWDDDGHYYKARVEICRWENGREQGYVVSLRSYNYKRQLNIAFFEHRNSDNIEAIRWEQVSFNSISTIELAEFGEEVYQNKYDTSHTESWGDALKMAQWIIKELASFWMETEKERIQKIKK